MRNMNKAIAIFAGAAILAATAVSCKNFMSSNDNLKDKIVDQVTIANAEKVQVTVSLPVYLVLVDEKNKIYEGKASSSYGSVTPVGAQTQKVGVAFNLIANPDNAYGFIKWAVYDSTDTTFSTELSGLVSFGDATSAETTATLLSSRGGIVIAPVVDARPAVDNVIPTINALDVVRNASISIRFTKPMSPTSFDGSFENIDIVYEIGGAKKTDVTSYFNTPSLSSDGRFLSIQSKTNSSNKNIPAGAKVTVKVKKEATDTKGLNLTEDVTAVSYTVGSGFDTVPPQIGSVTGAMFASTFDDDEWGSAYLERRTNQNTVFLKLQASDDGGDIASFRFRVYSAQRTGPTLPAASIDLWSTNASVIIESWDISTPAYSFTVPITGLTSGRYYLYITAKDSNGVEMSDEDAVEYAFVVDKVAPSVTGTINITGASNESWINLSSTGVKISGLDGVADGGAAGYLSGTRYISYSLDGTTYTDNILISGDTINDASGIASFADGTRTVYAKFSDDIGNTTAAMGIGTLKVDRTAPAISSFVMTSAAYNAVKITGVTDNSTVTTPYYNGTGWFVGDPSQTFTLSASDATSAIASYLVSGNSSLASSAYDSSAPVVLGTASASLSSCITGSTTLNDGTPYIYYLYVKDVAGNMTKFSTPVNVTRDATAPANPSLSTGLVSSVAAYFRQLMGTNKTLNAYYFRTGDTTTLNYSKSCNVANYTTSGSTNTYSGVTFTFASTDAGAGLKGFAVGAPYGTGTGNGTGNGGKDGTSIVLWAGKDGANVSSWTVYAVDKLGTYSSSTLANRQDLVVVKDADPLTVSALAFAKTGATVTPGTGSTYYASEAGDYTLTPTVTDISYALDAASSGVTDCGLPATVPGSGLKGYTKTSGSTAVGSNTTSISVTAGSSAQTVYAVDNAGNATPITFSLLSDTAGPVCTESATSGADIPGTQYYPGSGTNHFVKGATTAFLYKPAVTDDISGVQGYTISGQKTVGAITAYSQATGISLDAGTGTYTITWHDKVGNVSTTTVVLVNDEGGPTFTRASLTYTGQDASSATEPSWYDGAKTYFTRGTKVYFATANSGVNDGTGCGFYKHYYAASSVATAVPTGWTELTPWSTNNVTTLPAGSYKIAAIDYLGNATTLDVDVALDTNAPSAPAISTYASGTGSGKVYNNGSDEKYYYSSAAGGIKFTPLSAAEGSGQSGVDRYALSNPATTTFTTSDTLTGAETASGTAYAFYAMDRVQNYSAGTSVSVIRDSAPPAFTAIDSTAANPSATKGTSLGSDYYTGTYYKKNAVTRTLDCFVKTSSATSAIAVTASDSGSGIAHYRLANVTDGGQVDNATGAITGLLAGKQYRLYLVDNVDNVTTEYWTINTIVDGEGPAVPAFKSVESVTDTTTTGHKVHAYTTTGGSRTYYFPSNASSSCRVILYNRSAVDEYRPGDAPAGSPVGYDDAYRVEGLAYSWASLTPAVSGDAYEDFPITTTTGKTLDLRFFDLLGNQTAVNLNIVSDSAPPSGTIDPHADRLAQGGIYYYPTSGTGVTFTPTGATEAVSATQSGFAGYIASDLGVATLADADYPADKKPAASLTIPQGDWNIFSVDNVGNVSTAYTTVHVMGDSDAPTGTSISIETGVFVSPTNHVADPTPLITLTATDSPAGVAAYFLSASSTKPGSGDGGWKPWTYNPASTTTMTLNDTATADYTLNAGSNTVYAYFKDNANNITATAISASAFLDTSTAVPTFSVAADYIDTDADPDVKYVKVNNPAISLVLTDDAVGIYGYALSSLNTPPDATEANWTKVFASAGTKTYTGSGLTLSPTLNASTTAAQTRYAYMRDYLGNVSAYASDSVVYDGTAPNAPTVSTSATAVNGVYYYNTGGIPITVGGGADTAGGSGFKGYVVTSGTASASAATTDTDRTLPDTNSSTDSGTTGATVYRVYSVDNCDWISSASATTIAVSLDTGNPSVSSLVVTKTTVNSTDYTNDLSPEMTITATDTTSGVAKYLVTTSTSVPTSSTAASSTAGSECTGWLDWTAGAASITVSPITFTTTGAKTLYAYVMDNVGLISPKTTNSHTFTIKTSVANPTLTLTATKVNNGTNDCVAVANPAFTLALTDPAYAAKYSFTLNSATASWNQIGTPASPWSMVLQTVGTATEGLNTYYLSAQDSLGNISSTVSKALVYDKTAPTLPTTLAPAYIDGKVYFDSSANKLYYGNIDTFTVASYITGWGETDASYSSGTVAGSGVDTAVYAEESAKTTIVTAFAPVANEATGKTYYVFAKDKLGNETAAGSGKSLIVIKDTTAPDAPTLDTTKAITNGGYNSGGSSFYGYYLSGTKYFYATSAPTATIQPTAVTDDDFYSFAVASAKPATASASTAVITMGTSDLYAVDRVGNVSDALDLAYSADTGVPTIGTTPTSGDGYWDTTNFIMWGKSTSVNVQLTLSDGTGSGVYGYKVDAGTIGAATSIDEDFAITTTVASHTFVAYDNVGLNSTTKTVIVQRDASAPVPNQGSGYSARTDGKGFGPFSVNESGGSGLVNSKLYSVSSTTDLSTASLADTKTGTSFSFTTLTAPVSGTDKIYRLDCTDNAGNIGYFYVTHHYVSSSSYTANTTTSTSRSLVTSVSSLNASAWTSASVSPSVARALTTSSQRWETIPPVGDSNGDLPASPVSFRMDSPASAFSREASGPDLGAKEAGILTSGLSDEDYVRLVSMVMEEHALKKGAGVAVDKEQDVARDEPSLDADKLAKAAALLRAAKAEPVPADARPQKAKVSNVDTIVVLPSVNASLPISGSVPESSPARQPVPRQGGSSQFPFVPLWTAQGREGAGKDDDDIGICV